MLKGRLLLSLLQNTTIVRGPQFVPKFVQPKNRVQLRQQSNIRTPFTRRPFCTTNESSISLTNTESAIPLRLEDERSEPLTIPSFMFGGEEEVSEANRVSTKKRNLQILQDDEIRITSENVGKFMVMDSKHIDSVIPEGLAGSILSELSILRMDESVGYLIREKTIEIIKSLEKARSNNFTNTPSTLLDGRGGSGKSVILNQIVYWARKNGWLVVFIPSCYDFIGGGHITESTLYPGMYDQPAIGSVLCETLAQIHAKQFKAIPLKLDWTIEGFTRKPESTLYDLLQFGAEYQGSAVEAMVQFRKELSVVTEFPVLIAADGINHMFGNSHAFLDPVNTKLRPIPLTTDKLVLPSLFKGYKYPGLANGTMISTTSYTPHLTKNFFKTNSMKSATHIPPYTKQEFAKIIDFYEQTGYVSDDLPTNSRDYVYFLSEGLGQHIAKYCVTL